MTLGDTYISLVNLYNCFVFWDAAQHDWGEAQNKLVLEKYQGGTFIFYLYRLER